MSACAGFEVVRNDGTDDSVAHTVALGIRALPAQTAGCLFAVCDQPLLTAQTVERLRDTFLLDSSRIVSLSWQGRRGNPVIFPRALFGELAALSPGETGRSVLARHPALLVCVEADAENELADVDFREELARLRR
ncbi:MAG: NTP transferase domain-containing protein [Oscillospiraceae bacterium]